jgi:hypothetical protein
MGFVSGGEASESDSTVHFAEYLETFHSDVLNDQGSDWPNISLTDALNAAFGRSPFSVAYLYPDIGTYGSGYTTASFPSLFDMFGKFMAGLDLHSLWEKSYNAMIASSPIGAVINSQAEKLDDDIEQRVMPRYENGMRDIGAIHSSAFAVGRSIIEDTRIRSINDFSAKLQLGILESSTSLWAKHLDWNGSVISTYAELQRIGQALHIEADQHNTTMASKNLTWDLDLFDYARALMGALNGAPAAVDPASKGGPSPLTKGISGGLAGAAAGAYVGSVVPGLGTAVGAVIGGVVGFAAGYFS